jgi:cobalamin biosynthesis Mg chelatase CobN
VTTPKLPSPPSVLRGTDSSGCYSPPLGGEGNRSCRYITMRRLNFPIAFLVALVIPISGLVAAAPAAAYNVAAVYRDCQNNGQLTGHYSRAELQAALNQLPAEVSEYSACADYIRQALVRASSHSGGKGTSKGPIAGSSGGKGPGGPGAKGTNSGKGGTAANKPGSGTGANGSGVFALAGSGVHSGSSGGSSSLPVPLLVVLILLALTAVSGGAVAIRRRVVARHGT